MSNENRIYKNYYIANCKWVDLKKAEVSANAERAFLTEEILCWPKKLYEGEPALQIDVGKVGAERARRIGFKLNNADFSGADVLAVAVNGATPCGFVAVALCSGDGQKKEYVVNFFNDRWCKLLIDISDCAFLNRIARIDLSFFGAEGAWLPEREYLYVGEICFGNALDFQFERKNSAAFFRPQSCVSQGDGCLVYTFHAGEELLFPSFERARYSVLNGVIYIKDGVKFSVRNTGGCKNFRLYIATDLHREFSEERSVEMTFDGEGIHTRIAKIDGFSTDENERLCGLKLKPAEAEGALEIYDVSLVQEKDFLLDDNAKAFLARKPVKVRNPYPFHVPQKIFNVKDYGAKGNFYDNDTPAIQAAADAAAAQGGGVVLLEGGRFVASHIVLPSNIEFRIARDAILIQSERPQDYPYPAAYEHDNIYYTIQWAHNFLVHNKPLLYGTEIENVRICGGGKIRMADTGSEALMGGWPYYDIHCNALIHVLPLGFNKCCNIEISDITVNRANSYHAMFQKCSNLFINRVNFFDARCLSGDGIGLAATTNVLISNLMYASNDDGITLNPGYDDPRGRQSWYRNTPGQDNTVTNIEIRDSYINSGYGGWGKAIAFIPWGKAAPNQEYAQIKNIYVHDCILDGGHSVGTWCDDPYHGKQPYDGSELDDYSPVCDITFKNNVYLSKVDLMRIAVTNMVSDNCLKSASFIVNGDFTDRMCHWKAPEGVSYDLARKCVPLRAGQALYQIISSTDGRNEFEFSLKGSGELFVGKRRVPFSCEEGGKARICAVCRGVKNIRVGLTANTPTEVYGAAKL